MLIAFFFPTIAPAQSTRPAVEPWTDASLPVNDGLALWVDATRQYDAWFTHDRSLVAQEPFDVFYDGSGNRRHLTQPIREAQPVFIGSAKIAAIRLDGENDFLRWNGPSLELKQSTVFVVASARSNAGGFRAFITLSENGKNDYTSGFNIDLGPPASDGGFGIRFLNVEGKGFVGAQNLLKDGLPLEELNRITATVSGGEGNVRAYANGELTGRRNGRDNTLFKANNLIIGARCMSNDDTPPYIRSFLHGDVAEVIVYDRVLSDDERASVDAYLAKKYEAGADALNRSIARGTPLEPVKDPPAVQMFVPGFVTRTLPIDVTNINNVRYRPDGKLMALAYDGNIYLLSDTDGDGLEDKIETFWKNAEQIVAPIGMALTPPGYSRGDGLFIACKGKLSLIVDTNKDDVADKEIIVASGWPPTISPVDAMGVAVGQDQSIYFGLVCTNFISAYLPDEQGNAQYSLTSERGTILKVSPDFSKREIVCTGIRVPVGLAFDGWGELFCTDQEGATWLPNGNPYDELLHIQPGNHYGFPPQHPKLLPNVFDEPSTFDFMPQHQSTCGLFFNNPVNDGPTFGPASWAGDAFVCGQSRGKLFRTKLVSSNFEYVAQNQLIGSLTMLTTDACLSPAGDLVVSVHSGNPDWGTGPKGTGTLYKISYREKDKPQPVLCYANGPDEVRVAFDKPLDIAALKDWAKKSSIEFGKYVGAGDRFESIRPGYAVVKRQTHEPRHKLDISSVQLSADHRTVILSTSSAKQAAQYALTLPGFGRAAATSGEIAQVDEIDLAYDLCGVETTWRSTDGKQSWSGWLPHLDMSVARAFTANSAEHDTLWKLIEQPGTLTLRTSLNLRHLIQPAVQPGSQLDYVPTEEKVSVAFRAGAPLTLTVAGQAPKASEIIGAVHHIEIDVIAKDNAYTPVELRYATGTEDRSLTAVFFTRDHLRPRPLALRRFMLPWARPVVDDAEPLAGAEPIPQLAGGDWLRGKQIFFGNEAACSKCHTVNGAGSDLGADLSNLIHRDYESVLRDIRDPSGALNPDYTASTVVMKNGKVFNGIMRDTDATHFIVRGDLEGEKTPLARDDVKSITASKLSVMPSGILEGLGETKMRDLLTFLLTEPLQPAPIERKGAPKPRTRAEADAILKSSANSPLAPSRPMPATTQPETKPLRITLVAGPKDHGPGEHDYPLWQKRWTTLLALAENITVDTAMEWPSPEQWKTSDVIVNFSSNPGWTEARGKDLDAFFARGGGYVLLHWAVHGHDAPEALAERIGLASAPGIGFRHGAVDLTIRDTAHPITRGFTTLHFEDETYWNMVGDVNRIHVLADAVEEQKDWPQLWTFEPGNGRVVGSIMGHYTWTFDDPLYRIIVLRSICWAAGEQDVDRLNALATIGSRMQQ